MSTDHLQTDHLETDRRSTDHGGSTKLDAERTVKHLSFDVEGMTCASCAMRVQKMLSRVPGVVEASVNLAVHEASVVAEPEVTQEALVSAVTRIGYGLAPHSDEHVHGDPAKALA
ncbi:MAG: heavy-metal-associated domain-containing protein, partial [Actinobacteria bacterium]|nr:heavy-metal-associated domain-containing protein [Actinomycetota bacterium]